MATDEELLVSTTLSDNWNTNNADLPVFYYDDTVKSHDFRNRDAIKIYLLSNTPQKKGLGYTSKKNEARLTIDLRSSNRDRMMKLRDEVKRIIGDKRKTLTGWDIFGVINENKVTSYFNYHQYVIEVYLLKYRTQY